MEERLGFGRWRTVSSVVEGTEVTVICSPEQNLWRRARLVEFCIDKAHRIDRGLTASQNVYQAKLVPQKISRRLKVGARSTTAGRRKLGSPGGKSAIQVGPQSRPRC